MGHTILRSYILIIIIIIIIIIIVINTSECLVVLCIDDSEHALPAFNCKYLSNYSFWTFFLFDEKVTWYSSWNA